MTQELEEVFLKGLDENKDKLFRVCTAYAENQESAKDLFQDVLVNTWQALPSFKSASAIGTWMFRITLNICIRHQTLKNKLSKFSSLEGVPLHCLSIQEDQKENIEQLSQLRKCIKQLNEADKSIITLYLEELPYREIANITGLAENTIAVKVKRIKNKLFNCLKPSI